MIFYNYLLSFKIYFNYKKKYKLILFLLLFLTYHFASRFFESSDQNSLGNYVEEGWLLFVLLALPLQIVRKEFLRLVVDMPFAIYLIIFRVFLLLVVKNLFYIIIETGLTYFDFDISFINSFDNQISKFDYIVYFYLQSFILLFEEFCLKKQTPTKTIGTDVDL